MRAVTDEGPKEPNTPMTEPIKNIFTILEVVSEPAVVEQFRSAYADCSIRYGDLKKQLADDVWKFVAPINAQIDSIYNDTDYLRRVSRMGAERARESASQTLRDVREIIGFKPF